VVEARVGGVGGAAERDCAWDEAGAATGSAEEGGVGRPAKTGEAEVVAVVEGAREAVVASEIGPRSTGGRAARDGAWELGLPHALRSGAALAAVELEESASGNEARICRECAIGGVHCSVAGEGARRAFLGIPVVLDGADSAGLFVGNAVSKLKLGGLVALDGGGLVALDGGGSACLLVRNAVSKFRLGILVALDGGGSARLLVVRSGSSRNRNPMAASVRLQCGSSRCDDAARGAALALAGAIFRLVGACSA